MDEQKIVENNHTNILFYIIIQCTDTPPQNHPRTRAYKHITTGHQFTKTRPTEHHNPPSTHTRPNTVQVR
jgi:hypothetical protein